MRSFLVLIVLLGVSAIAAAEKVFYFGTYVSQPTSTKYELRLTVEQAETSQSFSVSGELTGAGQSYKVSGRVIAKTRKLRGTLLSTVSADERPERPIDGMLSSDGKYLTAQCRVFSPNGLLIDALFSCRKEKVSDQEQTIPVFMLDSQSGDKSRFFSVDPTVGTANVLISQAGRPDTVATVKFSPFPKYVARGSSWSFWLDATAIPPDVRTDLRLTAAYVDVTSEPYVTLDTKTGSRTLRRTLTWNMSLDNGGINLSIQSSTYSYACFYKLVQMNRSEYARMVGGANVASPNFEPQPNPAPTAEPVSAPVGPRSPESSDRGLVPSNVRGDISIRPSNGTGNYEPLAPGLPIKSGTSILVGSRSSATIPLPNGGTLLLQPVSNVWIEDLPPTNGVRRVAIRVLTGEVVYQHNGRAVPVKSDLIFRVGNATVKPQGTKFTIRYDEATEKMFLNIEEGAVDFDPGHDLPPMKLDAPTVVTVSLKKM